MRVGYHGDEEWGVGERKGVRNRKDTNSLFFILFERPHGSGRDKGLICSICDHSLPRNNSFA